MPKKSPRTHPPRPPRQPDNTDIVVEHVTMQFRRAKDEATSLKELLIRTLRGDRRYETFRALDDVSFTVMRGEVVGIIGTNGSGKSTMLKNHLRRFDPHKRAGPGGPPKGAASHPGDRL